MVEFETDESLLIFRVGDYLFCINAQSVEAIIQPPESISLPLVPDYVAGTFMFRGATAAIIDLRIRLGFGKREFSPIEPLIVTRLSRGITAFWVDEVRDIVDAAAVNWADAPDEIVHIVDRCAMIDGQLVLFVELEKIATLAKSEQGLVVEDIDALKTNTDLKLAPVASNAAQPGDEHPDTASFTAAEPLQTAVGVTTIDEEKAVIDPEIPQ